MLYALGYVQGFCYFWFCSTFCISKGRQRATQSATTHVTYRYLQARKTKMIVFVNILEVEFEKNSNLKIEIADPNFINNKMDEIFALNLFPTLDDSLHSDAANKRCSYLKERIIVFTK